MKRWITLLIICLLSRFYFTSEIMGGWFSITFWFLLNGGWRKILRMLSCVKFIPWLSIEKSIAVFITNPIRTFPFRSWTFIRNWLPRRVQWREFRSVGLSRIVIHHAEVVGTRSCFLKQALEFCIILGHLSISGFECDEIWYPRQGFQDGFVLLKVYKTGMGNGIIAFAGKRVSSYLLYPVKDTKELVKKCSHFRIGAFFGVFQSAEMFNVRNFRLIEFPLLAYRFYFLNGQVQLLK